MRKIFLIVSLLAFMNQLEGQTVSDINTKYGRPVISYLVSESIWMTPSFAGNGQVCRMRFYPTWANQEKKIPSRYLANPELLTVLIDLIPMSIRGKQLEPYGTTTTGGGAIWTIYPYENVTLIFSSKLKVNFDDNAESKPYVLSAPNLNLEKNTQITDKGQDVMVSHKLPMADVLTIDWNQRNCSF